MTHSSLCSKKGKSLFFNYIFYENSVMKKLIFDFRLFYIKTFQGWFLPQRAGGDLRVSRETGWKKRIKRRDEVSLKKY